MNRDYYPMHTEKLQATQTLADAAKAHPLPMLYHERVLLDFFIYTMGSEQRGRLMELHPVSYWAVIGSRR